MSKQSPAIELLDLVWANTNAATDHSWERLNHAMRDALSLAIGAGFEFAIGDIAHIVGNYRSGRWLGDVEWIYSLAVAVENASAYKSFEAWRKREPFIADKVSMHCRSGFTHGERFTRERERLTVGAEFQWNGFALHVNSFAADQSYLNAASSTTAGKRFKITRDNILSARADQRERKKLLDQLTVAATYFGNANKIAKALGVKTNKDYATLPMAKIRDVAKKFPLPDLPLVTKEHHDAAKRAGFCSTALKRYPVGTPIVNIDDEDWQYVRERMPELAASLETARRNKPQEQVA